jgi:hypothetical protein
MDYEAYQRLHFTNPEPEPRFGFQSVHGATLYFADYDAAVRYYTEVLGEPAYVEGAGTRGWRIGGSWLTLLAGGDGAPSNTEIGFAVESAAEAERLQASFIAAGGTGSEPTDALMYRPVRACPITDPFGTSLLVYAPLR